MQSEIKINAKLRGTWCFIVDQFKPMTGRYRNAVGHAASLGVTTDQTAEVNLGLRFAHLCVLASLREIAFLGSGLTQSRQAAKKNRKGRLPGSLRTRQIASIQYNAARVSNLSLKKLRKQ